MVTLSNLNPRTDIYNPPQTRKQAVISIAILKIIDQITTLIGVGRVSWAIEGNYIVQTFNHSSWFSPTLFTLLLIPLIAILAYISYGRFNELVELLFIGLLITVFNNILYLTNLYSSAAIPLFMGLYLFVVTYTDEMLYFEGPFLERLRKSTVKTETTEDGKK